MTKTYLKSTTTSSSYCEKSTSHSRDPGPRGPWSRGVRKAVVLLCRTSVSCIREHQSRRLIRVACMPLCCHALFVFDLFQEQQHPWINVLVLCRLAGACKLMYQQSTIKTVLHIQHNGGGSQEEEEEAQTGLTMQPRVLPLHLQPVQQHPVIVTLTPRCQLRGARGAARPPVSLVNASVLPAVGGDHQQCCKQAPT